MASCSAHAGWFIAVAIAGIRFLRKKVQPGHPISDFNFVTRFRVRRLDFDFPLHNPKVKFQRLTF